MRAEIYGQLIKLGFEEEEATSMAEEFAGALGDLGKAGYGLFGWAAKAFFSVLVEGWAGALLF